jgi:hypothetical protein
LEHGKENDLLEVAEGFHVGLLDNAGEIKVGSGLRSKDTDIDGRTDGNGWER